MSNFSSLELEQPIEQPFFKDSLNHPIWIGLFTSVIIHTILGVNLPKLSLFSEKAKLPPTVGFIELTPEQLQRLPQPEEEIKFSTVPSEISLTAPTTPGEIPPLSSSSSSDLPTIPLDPSDYKLSESSPAAPSPAAPSPAAPSPTASELLKNQPSIELEFSDTIPGRAVAPQTPIFPPPALEVPTFPSPTPQNTTFPSPTPQTTTFPSPIPRSTIFPSPVPSTNFPPIDRYPIEPPQPPNQSILDEYQIRKNQNLTNEVNDSGLSRGSTPETTSQEVPSTEKFTGSYSDGLELPPERYQDKPENQIAVIPTENNTDTQPEETAVIPTEETSVAAATPETTLSPKQTSENESPKESILEQLWDGKTLNQIQEEAKQGKIIVIVPRPKETEKSEPETVAVTPETILPPEQTTENEPPKSSILEELWDGKTLDEIQEEAKQETIIIVTPSKNETEKSEPEIEKSEPETVAVTPKTTLPPEQTTENEPPKSSILEELWDGKTLDKIREEVKQGKIIIITPTETEKSEPETLSVVPTAKASPKLETQKELESLLSEKAETTPNSEAEASPTPEENLAANNLEETQPSTSEEEITPTSESSPSKKGEAKFEGSMLDRLKELEEADAALAEESQSRNLALGAFDAYTQWAIELGLGEESLTQPRAISGIYPDAACRQKLEGKAIVGVLVNPDGSISVGPKLLLESGSTILDDAALDAVAKESFDVSDESKLYQYEFNFDSSSCNG
ncbi:energy transducer TonB [Okeania sp.]|uniref:energy transducer TonB n=1 Tax=Okeania sp. TaxID=3100323 RepID=UPI002B4AFC60|nr:energy transducer TonB [Okeania sp.]MEB3342159.1 energy transducer TonB [Okeania sp.]